MYDSELVRHFRYIFMYLCLFSRFGGKQVHASIDDGSVNHALVRDLEEETDRLEKFGAELEAD